MNLTKHIKVVWALLDVFFFLFLSCFRYRYHRSYHHHYHKTFNRVRVWNIALALFMCCEKEQGLKYTSNRRLTAGPRSGKTSARHRHSDNL